MVQVQGRLLVVDDDAVLLGALEQWLRLSGFVVTVESSVDAALTRIEQSHPDAILTDLRLPGKDGIALLNTVQTRWPDIPVVLLTGHGDVQQAVDALKRGAFDFLTKPHDPDRLVATLRNAATQSRMRRALDKMNAVDGGDDAIARRLLGHSDVMRRLHDQVRALVSVPVDVLLFGETGVGKEVVARTLHDCGPRADKPFVAINCAAIPAEMIESELFGHEAGAFTGAKQARIGKFEFARGGTVFLDEIESMPLGAQAKLLRVLQERSVERVGGNRSIPIDIRVISAAKDDLRALAQRGVFRDDLYYRLAGFELDIPPLRARDQDVLLLFMRFAETVANRAGRAMTPLLPYETATLLEHDWPGNVRELRHAAERYGLCLGLDINRTRLVASETERPSLDALVATYERKIILATLNETAGSIARTLDVLNVPRRTLNDKMRRYNIQRTGDEEA